jgi:hypothetical protein
VSNLRRNQTHGVRVRHRGVTKRISALWPWMLGGLIVVLFLLAFIYHSVSQSPAAQSQQVYSAGAGRPGQPLGVPAITPHLNLDAANPAQASLPTYTAADATAYANAHDPEGLKSLAPFAVTKVQFMTDAQADQQLNVVIGLGPSAPVCVVEVHGHFQASRAPANTNIPTFDYVNEIFDGRTGNFLASLQAPN